ncbi:MULTISPECIES: type 1 glutamine amidotransferase [Enterococcus]|uniref:Lipid II isoglutaminyl synthase (glutamine-hydrolyzing) subunit GatD n=1 Tax=Enterococcus sulfureus ATCC 49903 TaxID=1140003 RepID=S0PG49_9ENTE|nr:type 1 glutamine amidotransferase [Enterococcus sulfureus]EOT48746.1 CobB/CobQ-like glutamine amidotransferase [Enterococcus sulfureus ATCC 49903]EOT87638.1 CobB/CobQ-like glutamine amidotransferase [Enterococcus sulfureus ATCC 49903]
MNNYTLNLAHLYGNLLNTYGDNGNILMLQYVGRQLGITVETTVVSIHEPFDDQAFDLIFFGGGQDYEQVIVAKDLPSKKEALTRFIEEEKVVLAICGGYQMLGHYYIGAKGEKINGISALDHYTISQENNRFIGDVKIYNETFDETYYGFENHNGRTFLGEGEQALGKVLEGKGNNGEDQTEGVIYKNVFGSYFHGPLLARNPQLAERLIKTAFIKKYGETAFDTLTKTK